MENDEKVWVLIPAPPPLFTGIAVFDSMASALEYVTDLVPLQEETKEVRLEVYKAGTHGWRVTTPDRSAFYICSRPVEHFVTEV